MTTSPVFDLSFSLGNASVHQPKPDKESFLGFFSILLRVFLEIPFVLLTVSFNKWKCFQLIYSLRKTTREPSTGL